MTFVREPPFTLHLRWRWELLWPLPRVTLYSSPPGDLGSSFGLCQESPFTLHLRVAACPKAISSCPSKGYLLLPVQGLHTRPRVTYLSAGMPFNGSLSLSLHFAPLHFQPFPLPLPLLPFQPFPLPTPSSLPSPSPLPSLFPFLFPSLLYFPFFRPSFSPPSPSALMPH